MKKPSHIEHEKLWNNAVENCKSKGKKGKKAYEAEYNKLMEIREKPRKVFDKKLLCFKINRRTKQDPEWDYSINETEIKDRTPTRDLVFRTVKHITSGKCDTFADVLKFRVDWIRFIDGFGTEDSIRASINVCKLQLNELDDELEKLGFERMNFAESLKEENRGDKDNKVLSEKLEGLGLKRK